MFKTNISDNKSELPKVLIIDDIEDNLLLLSYILKNENISVKQAQSGKEGLPLVDEFSPDLILLDIAMPNMDGYEFCRIVKENKENRNIPIIFLTAKIQEEDIIKGFEVGAVDYVLKPFNSRELISRVETHLKLKLQSEQLKSINQSLEIKVAERTKGLSIANKKLSSLNQAKDDFISLIAHELRTPINGILGFAQILNTAKEDNKRELFIKEINKSADRLNHLSETALLITSLKLDNYELDSSINSFKEIISMQIENFSSRIKEKNISLCLNLLPEADSIYTDTNLLEKCLHEIIDNAIKFVPENSKIIILSYNKKDHTIFEFINEGSKFPSNIIDTIFDYFTINNINYHDRGLGLGLASCKLIMNTLRGSIIAENNSNGCASVKLLFNKHIA